jgi:hypothetical protein
VCLYDGLNKGEIGAAAISSISGVNMEGVVVDIRTMVMVLFLYI